MGDGRSLLVGQCAAPNAKQGNPHALTQGAPPRRHGRPGSERGRLARPRRATPDVRTLRRLRDHGHRLNPNASCRSFGRALMIRSATNRSITPDSPRGQGDLEGGALSGATWPPMRQPRNVKSGGTRRSASVGLSEPNIRDEGIGWRAWRQAGGKRVHRSRSRAGARPSTVRVHHEAKVGTFLVVQGDAQVAMGMVRRHADSQED